ncbi:MAG: JAB domain-containing protein [Bdellovibrionaceae bacterium]|nr:JAB domain-containing protein [Pseudobdellovibrionaceae bacterium]
MQDEITCSRTLEERLRPLIRFDVEEVWAVAFSSRLVPIATELIFRGDASGCQVHPREIFRFALRQNAVSVAIAHSHPSNDPEPSLEDLHVTHRLCMVGRLVGIALIDHLVMSESGAVSMANRGYFREWRKKRSIRI